MTRGTLFQRLLRGIPASLFAITILIAVTSAGCGDDDAPATSTPPPVPGHPLSARTGNTQADAVLDAVTGGDTAAVRSLLDFVALPCAATQMLGGPPPCPPGTPTGTLVDAFPLGQGCEGSYVDAGTAEQVTITLPPGARLYAVFTSQPAAGNPAKLEFPRGATVIVFTYPSGAPEHPVGSRALHVTDGRIVTMSGWCLESPADRVAGVTRDAFLLAPP
jgi:hypothetical protein